MMKYSSKNLSKKKKTGKELKRIFKRGKGNPKRKKETERKRKELDLNIQHTDFVSSPATLA